MLQRILAAAMALSATAAAHAHPGHAALTEWHWHATDTTGLLVVGLLTGLAIWLSRKQ